MATGVFRYLLFTPLNPEELSLLKDLTTAEICKVWEATSKYIRRQLLEKRAVDIGIGSFAVVPTRAAAGPDGALEVDTPVFQLNQHVQTFYKLKDSKTKIPSQIFEHPLNFEEIAETIYFRTPIVEQCIHETLLFLAEALRGKKEVDFLFRRLGILSLRGRQVTMNFFDDCALELDATGNMLPALLGDSEMMNMIAFRGKNKFTRRSVDGCIVLPRLGLENSKTSQETTSVKPQRELQPWGGGARRVSVYDPVMLARRRVSKAVKAEQQHKEEEKKKQRVRFRFLPQLEQMYMEELRQPKPPAQPGPSARAQQASKMAARSVRAQIEERRLQVLMASKRKEVEAEIQGQRRESTQRQSVERSQNPFHRLLEGDPRPSYVLRREYNQKLVEQHQNTAPGTSNCAQGLSGRTSHRCTLPPLQQESCQQRRRGAPFQR
ncbi:coiled-coil domain-containing protein 81-like [Numida meleagris]|uniref:coiled-coil domain-containing protein 81-like n=1 Tax=Numida meleagris TaxID=8996 RepID=UPI000B3D9BD4|nr:coiled-coil domain-containing protein 81-like [Numida meleagris]